MAELESEKAYLVPSALIVAGVASATPLMNSRMYARFGDQMVNVTIPVQVAVFSDRIRLMASDIYEFLDSVRVTSKSPVKKSTTSAKPNKPQTHGAMVQAFIPFHTKAGRLIVYFIVTFFKDLRRWICGDGKTRFPLSTKTTVGVTSLAHLMVLHWGVSSMIAPALASSVLIAIFALTKGAFCKMTAQEALKAIVAGTA